MKEYMTVEDAMIVREKSRALHIRMGYPRIKKNIYRKENGAYIVAMPFKASCKTRNTTPIE